MPAPPCRAPAKPHADLREVVEQRVRNGGDQEGQQQHQRLPSDDDEPNRPVGACANAARDDEREHPCDERERRHQNRPQSIAARLEHGGVTLHSALAQLIGVIDLQN